MKSIRKLIGWLAFAVSTVFAEEKPVKLERVEVKEAPFGQLGIGVVCHTTWLALLNKETKIKDMVVTEIRTDSVAEKSGLRIKDEIVKLDGVPVSNLSVRQLLQIWNEKDVGDLVKFEVKRAIGHRLYENKLIEIPVEKKQPNPSPPPQKAPSGRD